MWHNCDNSKSVCVYLSALNFHETITYFYRNYIKNTDMVVVEYISGGFLHNQNLPIFT